MHRRYEESTPMLRSLFAAAAALLLAGSLPAKEIKIFWHGQSFFEIRSSGGTTVAIDPHFLEAYGRREVKADVVLVSHFHIDHTAPEPIADFEKGLKDGKIKLFTGLKNPGFNMAKNQIGSRSEDKFNNVDEKVKEVRIKSVGAYHDNRQGLEKGLNSVFIVEMDGLRIVHLGDLGHLLSDDQLKKIGKVDILMIPVGGVYTINGADARKVVEQLKPTRYIIPMHCGTKVYDDLLTPDEFLDGQPKEAITKTKFNELDVDTDAAVPKQPIVALINYEPKEEKPKEEKKDK